VVRLAIHFDISSDTNEPPKPNSAAITSKPPNCREFTPSTDITMLTSASTAMLVARKSNMRLNIDLSSCRGNAAVCPVSVATRR